MLSQIHEACQRQQASKAASSLRRKYHRQRWKAKPQSFMNGSTVGRTSANFKTPSVAPSGSTQTHFDTLHARDIGSGQRSSPWKCATSQAAAGNAPVLVMDFSTPPSSGPSSPSDSSPDLDRTYEVRTSPPVPHTSRCSEQQVRKQQQQQQVNKVKSLYPHVGVSHASQPVIGLCDVRPHTQVFPSTKRGNYEGSLSSPSKMNSVLKSPSHHHHHNDMSVLMEYSPPHREEAPSSPRRFSYTQLGHPEKQCDEARWTSQMKSISSTQYSVSPQQQTSRVRCSWQTEELSSLGGETMPSPHPYMGGAKCNSSGTVLTGGHSPYKRRFLNGEASQSSFSRSGGVERVPSSSGTMGGYRPYMRRNLSGEVTQSSFSQKEPSRSVLVRDYSPYKQQCLSREAAESSPSKASLGRNSFIHSAYSASGSKLSSHSSHPEVYTSPSHRHHHHQQQHHHQDLQENLKPSPSRLEALQTRRRSFSGPKDAKRSPARRLSSSIQHINQEFRQLYHQHICQRKSRSSLSRHRSSCCLCEQKAEGCSPSSRVSSVNTTTTTSTSASATNSRLAALSLTPVRRRRFQSDLSPLLKRLQRKRQVPSSLLQSQHHQKSQQQPLYSYSNDCDDTASMTSDASDDDQPPDLYRGAQISSGSRHHNHQHHYYPTGSSSTLAALGLAPPHARLSKRRCLSEPKESPSLKRFRESTQAHLSPSKSHGFPQHQCHQQRVGGDDDDDNGDYDGGEEDMMAPVGNGLSEEHLIRSRALLLQCPSPRFLRAAMRLMKAGSGSRTRPSLEARPHASAWVRAYIIILN